MACKLLTFIILMGISSASTSLNFYISQQESVRLLGIVAELAYVRDGIINSIAQHFVVPVPPHIQELCFIWESLSDTSVKYTIATKVSNVAAINQLKLNISDQGFVPRRSQLFCLFLPCTQKITAEVEISMRVNFTISSNITSLNIMLKKECLGDVLSMPMEDPSYMMYIAVGVAFAVLLITLAAVAIFLCPKHNLCRPQTSRNRSGNTVTLYAPVQTTSSAESTRTPIMNDAELLHLKEISLLTIQRTDIAVQNILLEGTFGCVYQATLQTPDKLKDVIVKTVKDNAAEIQTKLMIKEGSRFQDIVHPNICSLIGLVEGDTGKPILVYPFISHGNLKRWLLHCKGSLDGSLPHPLCTQDLVTIALQILQGTQYLHYHSIIHQDLATRNCVIGDNFHVKLTDTALSRDLFPNDYHCLGDNENRPIKWMAIESLTRREYSTASDIWSFGVVLWEVTTLAQQPYVEVDPFEVARVLKDGYRLTQPVNCPDELYAIMAYCWASSPQERPTASQLYRELNKFHRQLNEYI